MFRGTRLAGDLREAQKKRFRQPSTLHAKNANRLFLRGALQNHGVEILNAPSEFRPSAQDLVELLDLFVQGGGAFEVQLLAGFFAIFLDRSEEHTSELQSP